VREEKDDQCLRRTRIKGKKKLSPKGGKKVINGKRLTRIHPKQHKKNATNEIGEKREESKGSNATMLGVLEETWKKRRTLGERKQRKDKGKGGYKRTDPKKNIIRGRGPQERKITNKTGKQHRSGPSHECTLLEGGNRE